MEPAPVNARCCQKEVTFDGASQPFKRALWLVIAINAVMFVVEIVAGLLSNSQALQADALDFLGDSANYAISLVVLPMGLAARARAAAFKGFAMAAFGLWVIGGTALRALSGTAPDPHLMGATGVLALLANVGVAALLYRYRAGDANMRSVWLCSRNDALANVAVILAAGASKKRFILPHARVMIHQPFGGVTGQTSDVQIQVEEILEAKNELNKIIGYHTGKDPEQVERDSERDRFFSAKEAKDYGLVDDVLDFAEERKTK